jgi:nucleoside-diphosphate-sugar epimerase
MSERYFITGALGCIGAWIVKVLAERGDVPVIFDQSTDTHRLQAILEPATLGRLEFLKGDITDAASVREALTASRARRVIHLAGVQVPTCRANPILGAMVNVLGTLHVFEAARAAGVERVVYASSAAVFGLGEDDEPEPLDEAAAKDPLTHYGVFKRTNEGNARVYFTDHKLSSVGLRPFTVYGVGRDTGLTSDPTKAMKAAVVGRPFHIRFSGITDFQYVADTAAAFIASADQAPAGAHVFNLHGETRDVADVVGLIDEALPAAQRGLITHSGPVIPIAPWLSDAAFRSVIGDLGVTTLAEGIRETVTQFAALQSAGRLDVSELDA